MLPRFTRTVLSLMPVLFGLSVLIALQAPSHARSQAGNAHLTGGDWPQPAPRLQGSPADWLNTDGKPLQIEKGKVYVIDFFEYTCVNCLRTLPYLKEWQKRYAKDGLVIIGIHTPEFAFARDRKNVADAVKRLEITWPVLIDSRYRNWTTWQGKQGVWPRKYFVDARGRVVADHSGEGSYQESESRIQRLLRQANPKLTFPQPLAAVRDTDKPGARCYPTTAEIYAGQRGAQNGQHGNIDDYQPGETREFQDSASTHEDGRIYLNGDWKTEAESLRQNHAVPGSADYLALRYHALECNAVIKPEGGKSFRVYIIQDGKPIEKTEKGEDIRYDEQGASYVLVDNPRMYSLVRNTKFGSHELRLSADSVDFGLYSFTFSSCEIK